MLKLNLAVVFVSLSGLINLYGLVALLLVALNYSKLLILAYLGLAILTIPIFLIVRLLTPVIIWRKTAVERNFPEQLFIRLYDVNFMLAAVVWAILIALAVRHG